MQLKSVFEEVQLVYKNRMRADDRPVIKSASDAYRILLASWDITQINLVEECKILLLDRQLRVMSIASISKGGRSETVIDPKIVFSIALKRRADRLILAHNHPSGELRPSIADIKTTEKLMLAGKALSLPLEDHIIVTQDNYCSLVNEGHVNPQP